MEVPRLGVQLELLPPACTAARATLDLSRVCDLHHSSRQRRIVNPLSKGRDRTRNLIVPSRIRQPLRYDFNIRKKKYYNKKKKKKKKKKKMISRNYEILKWIWIKIF